MEFEKFPKMGRLSRTCLITEKIDGTNAQVAFDEEGNMFVGSRKRWITPEDDNYGFAAWCHENIEQLRLLGPGRHFGEWWGSGIQRRYGMQEKVFSLFNTTRWKNGCPECCRTVPVMYHGLFSSTAVDDAIHRLIEEGSLAAPGFMNPEGVVVYHQAAGVGFKKTVKNDEKSKWELDREGSK